jgi:hypothetical protein
MGGLYERDSPSFSFMGGRIQSLLEKGPDLPKHCQILHLSPVTGTAQSWPKRKQAVCSIPAPKTHWQIREFLGAAGFCRIWIPNCSLLPKPLYQATSWEEWKPLVWEEEQEKAFREIKRALTNAPAVGMLEVMKPFFLYVHEQKGTAVGILTQLLGSWHHPVAYLSKQLNAISQGWLPCLSALAATASLVTKAEKLTLGQKLIVWVFHSILTLMEYKGNYWLTNSQWSNTRVCCVKTHASGWRLLRL